MITEKDKMRRARDILNIIIQGREPFNSNPIQQDSFLHDPRMIRCFSYINQILTNKIEGKDTKEVKIPFKITQEELKKIEFPKGDLGLTDFVKCINTSINTNIMKKLTVKDFTTQLKIKGILGEQEIEENRRRTICIEESTQYGFYTKTVILGSRQYDRVMINDIGKEYLIGHFLELMDIDTFHVNE